MPGAKLASNHSYALFDSINQKTLNSVTDSLAEAICIVDAQGIVRFWNSSSEKLYDLPASEIVGQDIKKKFPNALLIKVLKNRVAQSNVYNCPKENAHVLLSASPLFIDEEFIGAISSDRDYNEVIQLYSELQNSKNTVLFLKNEIKRVSNSFGGIIGNSTRLLSKINIARQIAPANSNAMLTGESGTGKEVFARGIHEYSGLKGLFVPVNCSAIPKELFESEFFGYVPGAFTGASRTGKPGIFELAKGGTVFLDEIGDMPLYIQGKLLRVLQEREATRVGGTKPFKLNVRIIAATNKSLKELMLQGAFREDLYYRLNVIEIDLPPLRERQEDIPMLINHFNRVFSEKNNKEIKPISRFALKKLTAYSWPGNIRELMNIVENMVVISNNKILSHHDIPDYIHESRAEKAQMVPAYQLALPAAIKRLEKENIMQALEIAKYNKSRAAELLKIPRATLYSKAKEHSINLSNPK